MSELEEKFEAHVRGYRARAENLKKALSQKNILRNSHKLDALFKEHPPLSPSRCPSGSEEETYEWSYEIKDLSMTLSGLRHPQPPGTKLSTGTGLLSCKVVEFYSPGRIGGVQGILPVKSVEVDFVIEGSLKDEAGDHPLVACWHIDTHVDDPAANARPSQEREDNHSLHPLIHYQFGGRKLRPTGSNVRGVMVLDVPRVPVPPLDLNLTVDFIVTNYLGVVWKDLRRDTRYAAPVRTSMQRIWGPYYQMVSSHFSNPSVRCATALSFHPNLL
jgi:hypothetical protein